MTESSTNLLKSQRNYNVIYVLNRQTFARFIEENQLCGWKLVKDQSNHSITIHKKNLN
jgi:hypothetical protein